ncbi:hypothetical protein GCM10009069_30090 [Algimonas arctica]|uniref:DUF11 domain-containing protein n=1 Tax=Algimonas arctica TaxID=1479486 RepID=A0A8J3CVD6_9PROT|nr:hypothetical protein GCM10009069_30090 [Algimonas arctica]
MALLPSAHAATFGTEVTGNANLSYDVGGTQVIIPTNSVSFTIVPPQVDPIVKFFRFTPNNPQLTASINGADFSPSGSLDGPFIQVDPQGLVGTGIDLGSPLGFSRANTFLPQEPIFISVDYITGNNTSGLIETLTLKIFTQSGDTDVFRLYETGPDTGVFWAYLPTTRSAKAPNDGYVSIISGEDIIAEFEDNRRAVINATNTSEIIAENRIFDSVSGGLIDGVGVRLINVDTGAEATVFGIDDVTPYPSHVISGAVTMDADGTVYEPGAGAFIFPRVEPGRYKIQVESPTGYGLASILNSGTIAERGWAGFLVSTPSFGDVFEHTETGPIRFDIPLDPQSDLSVTLSTNTLFADIGDLVTYTAQVINLGVATVPVTLDTVLPKGFRYIEGSTQGASSVGPEPVIDPNGRRLTYGLGVLGPGGSASIDFTAIIGPNVWVGEATATAAGTDNTGAAITNRASSSLTLREDLLRSNATVTGRIAEGACDIDAPWVRAIQRGRGVAGIRIYMETGAYVVSDENGQFHFEGVRQGTHVVQVDRQTLPPDYELVRCKENTRYTGSAQSQFVDVQGGGLWRADFFLRKSVNNGLAKNEVTDQKTLSDAERFNDVWLAKQTDAPEWVYPDPNRTPSKPSINVGIKHPVGSRVAMTVNGRPVDTANLVARDTDVLRTVMISHFKGVDILSGENVISVTIQSAEGGILAVVEKRIAYVEEISRASAVVSESILVADGRTTPVLAIRLEDRAGRAVHVGREASVSIPTPYRLQSDARNDQFGPSEVDNISALGADDRLFVEQDGVLRLRLQPTLQTGPVTVQVTLDDGRIVPVEFYIRPEKRDWIVVGLAETTIASERIRDNMVGLAGSKSAGVTRTTETSADGRVAFFAKGMIKGEWLMTLAIDTDKGRGSRDGDFLTEIDPNAYYTLYGDASYQALDGSSRYPLFLKLEKDTAYALFGDFDTGLQEGKLTLYNRRLSGLKAEYLSETFQVQAFAAETNQGFAKDELPADGTSGPYRLSNTDILAQSETVIVETRDRVRADIVLDRRELVRFRDYTLDYFTGELIFSFPVALSDADFNPNVIIVDYETSEQVERNITFGGRAQATLLDGQLKLGVNVISEDGSHVSAGSLKRLAGIDGLLKFGADTELRLEYAASEDASMIGVREAKLAEITHTSRNLSGEAYYREEEAGFGLGQTNSNTSSIRRYGLRGSIRLSEFTTEDAARRGVRTLDTALYREENLTTGDTRDAGEVTVKHQSARLSFAAGLRAARDRLIGRGLRESVLALARANYSIPRLGLSLLASREQPISGGDEVSDFPQRTLIGMDKTLGSRAILNLRHEITESGSTKAQNTAFGVTVNPWRGSTLSASSDLVQGQSLRRFGATLTLDQELRLSERWAASAGLRSRRVFARSVGVMDEFIQVAPDAAVSPLEINEDFTAAYAGLSYRDDLMVASIRGETRQAVSEDAYIVTASVARELSERLSMAGSSRITLRDPQTGASSEQVDVRMGVAWRPNGNGLIILNRTDFGLQSGGTQRARTKWVNNLSANMMVRENLELSFNHGIKYVLEDASFGRETSLVNLVGAETRFDVSPYIDLGLTGSILFDDAGNQRYSYGPSLGFAPADNIWMSLGYNFAGFEDADFAAAEQSRKGVYLKLRMKFDERSLRGLLQHVSPGQRQDAPNSPAAVWLN